MYLSVIIPAHNEEKNIAKTIETIYAYLTRRNMSHEIIVVENGSTDKTIEVVNSLVSSISTLKLVTRLVGAKGAAVKEGMLVAGGGYRLFTDADNSTSIDHIEKMMPFFDHGFDVVIGSIAVAGHKVAVGSEPVWRRLLGKMGNLFIQLMAVPGIHDTQRGFKIFSSNAAQDIFPKITISGWGFDVEVLALARKYGYKIKEVAVSWDNDSNSHVGPKAYLQVLMQTIQIRWNLWVGAYDNKSNNNE